MGLKLRTKCSSPMRVRKRALSLEAKRRISSPERTSKPVRRGRRRSAKSKTRGAPKSVQSTDPPPREELAPKEEPGRPKFEVFLPMRRVDGWALFGVLQDQFGDDNFSIVQEIDVLKIQTPGPMSRQFLERTCCM